MWIFIILNIVKLIIGAIIFFLTYNYINGYKDFVFAILSMGTGIFIFLWGLLFFILFGIFKIFSKQKNNILSFKSYKYSGLVAFYLITNFLLISFSFWNKYIGIIILIFFVILGLIL